MDSSSRYSISEREMGFSRKIKETFAMLGCDLNPTHHGDDKLGLARCSPRTRQWRFDGGNCLYRVFKDPRYIQYNRKRICLYVNGPSSTLPAACHFPSTSSIDRSVNPNRSPPIHISRYRICLYPTSKVSQTHHVPVKIRFGSLLPSIW